MFRQALRSFCFFLSGIRRALVLSFRCSCSCSGLIFQVPAFVALLRFPALSEILTSHVMLGRPLIDRDIVGGSP